MKVCLIIPPSPFLLDEKVFPFLGILKVAAVWEKSTQIDVLDLGGIENYCDVICDYFNTNLDIEFVGLTATTPQMPNAYEIGNLIRIKYDLKLVIGGPHVTLMHSAAKREQNNKVEDGRAIRDIKKIQSLFDVLVCGDGECTLEAIRKLDKGVVDVDDRKSSLFLTDQKFSESPFPARHLIDLSSYHYYIDGERATSLISQLGCPYQCFVSNTKIITSNCPNKKAKDVIVGDKLIGFDEENKCLVETEVVKKFEHIASEIYIITFEDETVIETTGEHPFYVEGKWKESKHLCLGDEVYNMSPNDKISLNKKLYNPAKRQEIREKISATVKALFKSGKINSDHLRAENRTEEYKENIKKYWSSDRSKNRRSNSSKRMLEKNPMFNSDTRQKATNTIKKRIANGEIVPFMCTPEYWDKIKICSNKHEQELLIDLLSEFGHRYEFVGDGSFRVGFYSPDFIDLENKKIIEYNGCWWHGCEVCFPDKLNKRDLDRINKFKEAGYKVHVIKSCEYKKNKEKVLSELREFTYNGKRIVSIEIEKRTEKVYNFECYPHHNFFAEYLLSHNCTFCSGRNSPFLRNIRTRSKESVLLELQHLYEVYGYKAAMFYDDELNVNKEMIPLMYDIARLGDKLGFQFNLRGFTKSELFTEEQAKAMVAAGFKILLTGFESGDDRILKTIRKRASKDDNSRCVEIAKKYGLKVKALMSIAHAGESYKTIENTKDWLLKVEPDDFDCTVITSYPGSPYFDNGIKTGNYYTFVSKDTGDKLYQSDLDYTKDADHYKGTPGAYRSYVWTDHLSSEELVKARDDLESDVRKKLNIPYNVAAPARKYEHSMGQGNILPEWILRSTNRSKETQ